MKLEEYANEVRRLAIQAIHAAGSGHPGGSLSCADFLTYLWFQEMNRSRMEPSADGRDRLVLSKGHACPALYAAAVKSDLLSHQELLSFRKLGSPLQGHPVVSAKTPWVETNTGSLGQGFSVAVGMALGLKYQVNPARVYVILGDGELQEGEVWEAAMSAAHYGLDNLCAIVDYNKQQSDDWNENIMALEPLDSKWKAFNWQVLEIDGHDFLEIEAAFSHARRLKGRPTVIIAHTVKGRGVSFMEHSPLWHGSVKLRDEETEEALRDLGSDEEEIRRYFDECIRS